MSPACVPACVLLMRLALFNVYIRTYDEEYGEYSHKWRYIQGWGHIEIM